MKQTRVLSSTLSRILTIIESLTKKDFSLLPKTKNLERTVQSILASAGDDIPLSLKAELEKLFEGYEAKPLSEKKECLLLARDLLNSYLSGAYILKEKIAFTLLESYPNIDEYRRAREILEKPLDSVRGIGPKLAKKFAKKDVHTVEDLLYFIPRDYEDRRRITPIAEIAEGETLMVYGEVIKSGPSYIGRRKVYEVIITDGTGYLYLKWFNFNEGLWRKLFSSGKKFYAFGEASRFGRNFEMIHPEVMDEEDEKTQSEIGRIVPVYSTLDGVPNRVVRRILRGALADYVEFLPELVPQHILKRAKFVPLREALLKLHDPCDSFDPITFRDGTSIYHKSLAFEEFFILELALALRKSRIKGERGIAFNTNVKLVDEFLARLPFRLTGAQERVFGEIKRDMASPVPMNRLLQGDVGCGKTVIAFLASLIAVDNGYQVALMTPTEVLAEQHYQNLRKYNQLLGLSIGLLTGSLPPARKREIREGIKTGFFQMVIGTHALFQEDVEFRRLGLVIIDEQHRFGVLQRAELRAKAKDITPDTLVMTATPIPRTLALTIYGDLDVSIIDEMPSGRKPVITKVFSEKNKATVYEFVKEELRKGHQAYVILPRIEESEGIDLKAIETYGEELKESVFVGFKAEILHGRMAGVDKERVMQAFKSGEVQVLISTTVVEVGVDVPNATVMVIEHAERFGLSQLHQLRGRVGRSDKQSYCFLIAYRTGFGADARKRLEILTQTNDGFRIAEEDLKLRGPGEFLGTKQSGFLSFRRADLVRDYQVLLKAREFAFELLAEDPELKNYEALKEELFRRWKEKLRLVEVA